MGIINKKMTNPSFNNVWNKNKHFELTKDDGIAHHVNDIVVLQEYNDKKGESGNEIIVKVNEVKREVDGIKDGWCIIGFKVLDRVQGINAIGEW